MLHQTQAQTDEVQTVSGESSETETHASKRATRAGLITVAKVSHTLSVPLADRLEEFAFRQRVSESAVIEFALNTFFSDGNEEALGERLRESGAGRRRRV